MINLLDFIFVIKSKRIYRILRRFKSANLKMLIEIIYSIGLMTDLFCINPHLSFDKGIPKILLEKDLKWSKTTSTGL